MQKFCKVGGGRTWVFFKKRGRSCKQHRTKHRKTMLKNEFGNFKGLVGILESWRS